MFWFIQKVIPTYVHNSLSLLYSYIICMGLKHTRHINTISKLLNEHGSSFDHYHNDFTFFSNYIYFYIVQTIIIILLLVYILCYIFYIGFVGCTHPTFDESCPFLIVLGKGLHMVWWRILSLRSTHYTLRAIKQHDRFIVMCGLQYRIKIYRFVHLELYILRISGRSDKTNYCYEM